MINPRVFAVDQDESDGGVGDDFALSVSYSGTN